MSVELLKSCMNVMATQGFSSAAFRDYFMRVKYDLLDDEAVVASLVLAMGQPEDPTVNVAALFELLLDEARMGLENDSASGPAFLESVETIISAGLEAGAFEQGDLMKFAAMYRRAGLSVPDVLTINPDKVTPPASAAGIDLDAQLEGLAKNVQAEGGEAYDLFNGLMEMAASLPEDMQAGFANHMATLANPIFERCALYFLLSESPLIQEATAAGLLERFETLGLQSGTLLFQPIVRGWLPAGAARDIIDALGKRARRKGQAGRVDGQEAAIIHDISASIADGSGAQSLSVVVERSGKASVAMVLTKTGHGIKDAFVVPCESTLEAGEILARVRFETSGADISLATLEMLLEAALADGIENGVMPAPGVLDVMESCDLFGLRPQARPLPELLELVDPEREIQEAAPQKLGRWINNDIALESLIPLSHSWFEDNAETRRIMERSRTARSMETKLWKHLDERRDIWARRFLQTAAMLRDAKRIREWKTLSASAFGLMSGRSLKRIPLMEAIVFATIEASDARMSS